MHETYFLSQNLAFLGIYIFDGEFDTLFSYLGGFERFYIPFTTSLSPSCIYIHEEFTTLFPYPSGFVRLDIYIYIKYSKKIYDAFGRHLISHQFPSSKVGGILCVLLKSGKVLTPKSRHNIPFTPTPHDLYRFGS
jgi:hypothetical protein